MSITNVYPTHGRNMLPNTCAANTSNDIELALCKCMFIFSTMQHVCEAKRNGGRKGMAAKQKFVFSFGAIRRARAQKENPRKHHNLSDFLQELWVAWIPNETDCSLGKGLVESDLIVIK